MKSLFKIFNKKKVLITGNTGFKGSWLTAWMLKLGANVVGFSWSVPTDPSMFCLLNLGERINHFTGDICDLAAIRGVIDSEQPDFIFHLAAQAIVSTSYLDPVNTVRTNLIGTMNLLEVLRNTSKPSVVVFVTSDKCYNNFEWVWGYRETDILGGKDIYSGSKACAEVIINSYLHSYYKSNHPVRFGIGRAGNVIGGGDWAKDRIIADCMRSWSVGDPVEIRSPNATRPWQHVLEPLSGYLTLAAMLSQASSLHGEAFNFGPKADQNNNVKQLLNDLADHWPGGKSKASLIKVTGNLPFHEAGLLKLNCDKALCHLKWEANLSYTEMIQMVGEWYSEYYINHNDMYSTTLSQIAVYEKIGCARNRIWKKGEDL